MTTQKRVSQTHPVQDSLSIPQLLPQVICPWALSVPVISYFPVPIFPSLCLCFLTWQRLLCLSRFSANQGVWPHPPEGGCRCHFI